MAHEALKRNIPLLYAARLCGNLIFFVPVIVIFFQAQGLSMTQDYINRHTWSDKRATVMSIKNLTSRLVFIVTAPAIGVAVDAADVRLGLLLTAAAAVAGGGALVIALKRDRVI